MVMADTRMTEEGAGNRQRARRRPRDLHSAPGRNLAYMTTHHAPVLAGLACPHPPSGPGARISAADANATMESNRGLRPGCPALAHSLRGVTPPNMRCR